jgi:hypothetical protein
MRSPAQRAHLEKLHALNRARRTPAQRAAWALHTRHPAWRDDPIRHAAWKAKLRVRSPAQRAHATKLATNRAWRADPLQVAAWKAKLLARTSAQRAHVKKLVALNRARWRDPLRRAAWKAKLLAGAAAWRAKRPKAEPHVITLEALLERYVEPEPNSACWLWVGPHTESGYGRVLLGCRPPARIRAYAHRWVYDRSASVLPPGFHLHHRCRVRSCVNPSHLQPLTPSEHARITGRQLWQAEEWLDQDADDAEPAELWSARIMPPLELRCLCGRTPGVFASVCCEDARGGA